MEIYLGFVVLLCCVVIAWVVLEALASHLNKRARR